MWKVSSKIYLKLFFKNLNLLFLTHFQIFSDKFLKIYIKSFNPFVPNAPFLYPWKRQKTLPFSDVFRGVEKGHIEKEWVKVIFQ